MLNEEMAKMRYEFHVSLDSDEVLDWQQSQKLASNIEKILQRNSFFALSFGKKGILKKFYSNNGEKRTFFTSK